MLKLMMNASEGVCYLLYGGSSMGTCNSDNDVDVNTAYDDFDEKIIDIYNKHVPVKHRKQNEV